MIIISLAHSGLSILKHMISHGGPLGYEKLVIEAVDCNNKIKLKKKPETSVLQVSG